METTPLLTAVTTAGITTVAQFEKLQQEAIAGREALNLARTDAKAAAVAYFGQDKPEKIKAAGLMVDKADSVGEINMLAETWNSQAPGANREKDEKGQPKRLTRSNAPSPTAVAEGEQPGRRTKESPSSGNVTSVYAQFNTGTGRR